MKNIIFFDVNGPCQCALVANIAGNENSVILIYESDYLSSNEKVSIRYISAETGAEKTIEKSMTIGNSYILDPLLFNDAADKTLYIKYVDDMKTGREFTFIQKNGSFGQYTTTIVVKTAADIFEIKPVGTSETVTSYSDDFVIEDGVLSLADEPAPETEDELTAITVTKSNDLITNVSFLYERSEPTAEEPTYTVDFPVLYDANKKISSINGVAVSWN